MPGRTSLDQENVADTYFLEFEKATNFRYSAIIGDEGLKEILGFKEDVQYALITAKLLKTVGKKNPAPNAPKQYSLRAVVLLRRDEHWLQRAAEVAANFRASKSASKKGRHHDPKDSPVPATSH